MMAASNTVLMAFIICMTPSQRSVAELAALAELGVIGGLNPRPYNVAICGINEGL
jgi:hypothetical protein